MSLFLTRFLVWLGHSCTIVPVVSDEENTKLQESVQGQAALAVLSAGRGGIVLTYPEALELLGCSAQVVMDSVIDAMWAKLEWDMQLHSQLSQMEADTLAKEFAPEGMVGTAAAVVHHDYRLLAEQAELNMEIPNENTNGRNCHAR